MNQVATIEGSPMQQAQKPVKPEERVQNTLVTRKAEFQKVLPAHISFEKFQRTVMTACFANPELFQTDLGSLMLSAIKCATDGLLPDNREAAFVIFNSKIKVNGEDRWVKKAQYLPMWLGILKKIRQSEDVDSVRAHVVYEADWKKGKFEYVLGDDERVIHEPYIGTDPRGPIIAAYCIAKLKSGEIIREVMTIEDIEKIRRTSKSGNKDGAPIGIWKDWYEEMARKTVFRRAAKWLPQSSELIDRVFANDDSIDTIENVGPAEIMTENPKAIPETTQDEPMAQIENNPSVPMQDAGSDLMDKVVAKQNEKEVSTQPKTQQTPPASNLEKIIRGVQNAIKAEETIEGLSEIFDKDFAADIEAIKKGDGIAFQQLVDMAEAKRQEIASK